jgi:hypothetical protein
VLAARLRFQELGGDEVMAFIRHQLPAGEAQRAFREETVTAIANVSGGDPMLVNRFARRLLDLAAAKTAKSFGKSSSNPTVVAPIGRPVEKGRFTTLDERPQDAAVPEPVLDLGEQIWTRMRPGISATVRLSVVIVVWLVCFGGAGAFSPDPAEEKVSVSSTLAGDASATSRESELSAGEAARSGLAAAASAAPAPVATLTGTPGNQTAAAALARAASPSGVAPTGAADAAPTGPPEAIMAHAAADPLMSPAGYEPTTVATSSSATLSATLKAAPTIATLTPITPVARLLLSTAEVTALIARGDQLLGTGDVVSARLFYERAADVGNGEAALKLGKTFDPTFLSFGRLSGVRGDPGAAIPWYRRARDLGQAEAEIHLKRLDSEFLK